MTQKRTVKPRKAPEPAPGATAASDEDSVKSALDDHVEEIPQNDTQPSEPEEVQEEKRDDDDDDDDDDDGDGAAARNGHADRAGPTGVLPYVAPLKTAPLLRPDGSVKKNSVNITGLKAVADHIGVDEEWLRDVSLSFFVGFCFVQFFLPFFFFFSMQMKKMALAALEPKFAKKAGVVLAPSKQLQHDAVVRGILELKKPGQALH